MINVKMQDVREYAEQHLDKPWQEMNQEERQASYMGYIIEVAQKTAKEGIHEND